MLAALAASQQSRAHINKAIFVMGLLAPWRTNCLHYPESSGQKHGGKNGWSGGQLLVTERNYKQLKANSRRTVNSCLICAQYFSRSGGTALVRGYHCSPLVLALRPVLQSDGCGERLASMCLNAICLPSSQILYSFVPHNLQRPQEAKAKASGKIWKKQALLPMKPGPPQGRSWQQPPLHTYT